MNRRHKELWIIWSVTFVFVVVVLSLLFTSRKFLPLIGAICGIYIAFLAVYTLVSWFTIPKHLRVRPTMPLEYQQLKLGYIVEEADLLLSKAKFLREGMHRKRMHRLYQMEHPLAEGVWRCELEVVSGVVIAYRVAFKSSGYVMMDEATLHGEGRFLVDPG